MSKVTTTLYIHPQRGAIRVREGFSWAAFFFGAVWAMAHHLWFPTFTVLAALELLFWFVVGRSHALGSDGVTVLAVFASWPSRLSAGPTAVGG